MVGLSHCNIYCLVTWEWIKALQRSPQLMTWSPTRTKSHTASAATSAILDEELHLVLVLNSLLMSPQGLESLLYVKESQSIRTSTNINLQNFLVKSRTAFNPYMTHFSVKTILLCLLDPRLLRVHTTFQDWKLLSHIHLGSYLNACKVSNTERWVLCLEMRQLTNIWLSCVCGFDLFSRFLKSRDLSGGHGVKSFSYDHYICRKIYVV